MLARWQEQNSLGVYSQEFIIYPVGAGDAKHQASKCTNNCVTCSCDKSYEGKIVGSMKSRTLGVSPLNWRGGTESSSREAEISGV